MDHRVGAEIIGLLFFFALFAINSSVRAQAPAASPSPATAAPTLETDFWRRETLIGDWGGARSRWKEKGVELEFILTQFYQGVASGGIRHDSEYNGKFEMTWKFDLAKVAGWKWWSSEIKTEVRWGGPLLGGTSAINPVNAAVLIPIPNGETVAITALNFTRLIPRDLQKEIYLPSHSADLICWTLSMSTSSPAVALPLP